MSRGTPGDYDGPAMGCSVTIHDRIGPDRIANAVEPLGADAALALLESAVCETVRVAFGSRGCGGRADALRRHRDGASQLRPHGRAWPDRRPLLPAPRVDAQRRESHLTDDDGVSPPGPILLGDVVIDIDQALRQAAEGDWGVVEELALLAIHGTLHLLGHDHAEIEEEERMRRLEHDVLGVLHRRHRTIAWQPGSLFDRAGHAVANGS